MRCRTAILAYAMPKEDTSVQVYDGEQSLLNLPSCPQLAAVCLTNLSSECLCTTVYTNEPKYQHSVYLNAH